LKNRVPFHKEIRRILVLSLCLSSSVISDSAPRYVNRIHDVTMFKPRQRAYFKFFNVDLGKKWSRNLGKFCGTAPCTLVGYCGYIFTIISNFESFLFVTSFRNDSTLVTLLTLVGFVIKICGSGKCNYASLHDHASWALSISLWIHNKWIRSLYV